MTQRTSRAVRIRVIRACNFKFTVLPGLPDSISFCVACTWSDGAFQCWHPVHGCVHVVARNRGGKCGDGSVTSGVMHQTMRSSRVKRQLWSEYSRLSCAYALPC